MAEHVQQVGLSQESCEVNFHDDWTSLAPSISEILKDHHLKAAIESLDTDVKEVPLALPKNPENYFDLEDQTNSLWTVHDVIKGNPVPMGKDINSVKTGSNSDQDCDTLNLSFDANFFSQVSLDTKKDPEIYIAAADLANCDCNSINIDFQTKGREAEENKLQINGTESFPIISTEYIQTQYKNLSDTLSQSSLTETLNTVEIKERKLSCSADRSKIIQKVTKNDWTYLASPTNEIIKGDHLKGDIGSHESHVDAVPPKDPENCFELKDQTNSIRMGVPVVTEGSPVLMCENISSIREDSGTGQNFNLSYNANSCSQVSLDAQEDAKISVAATDLASCDSIDVAFQTKYQEIEAKSLQINGTESFPISIECNKTEHKNFFDTVLNSFTETLNTDKVNDTGSNCSAGKYEIIHERMKTVDNSSDEVCTGEKQNILVTKSNAAEEHTHSLKYKPQFGNKKRKLPSSEETGEKPRKVVTETKSNNVIETCSVQGSSAENAHTRITDETAVAEENISNDFSTASISVTAAEAATSDKNNKSTSARNEPKSITSGDESLPNTAKCNKKPIRGKPSTCEGDIINKSVLTERTKITSASESVSRKGKKLTTSQSKLGKGKSKVSSENKNLTMVQNSSPEKERKITDIKRFLEQQESLAYARNLLRCEKQKDESNSTKLLAMKTGFEETFKDSMQHAYEEKVETLNGDVSCLETLMEQVKSLTEGEEDYDKCLSLFGNIRDKVSASLLLKYPVLVAVFEPIQRFEIDERIKQEAEDIYNQFNSMYIKQNMEDFVFNFDRTLKCHHRRLAKSERLAQKIRKRIMPEDETNTESAFDIETWYNLLKERDSVWDRFMQEFQESDKTTLFQAASGSSSQTSNIKEEVDELNNDFTTTMQEQQATKKLPQPSSNRTSIQANHSMLESNPKRAKIIFKPEHGVHNDDDVKPASNMLFVQNKKGTTFNTETRNTDKEIQRKQPARICKFQNIKTELSCDGPIIKVKPEIDYDTEIVDIKKENQQKKIRRSSKSITIKDEITTGEERIVEIKKEIDSDTDIQNARRDAMRIQPRRSCQPNKGNLELKIHFSKRKDYFNKEVTQVSKKAKASIK